MYQELTKCMLCPRECGIDRTKGIGYCGCNDRIKIARAALHFWEEPCISGKKGSGAVFFSGCTLKCCYCQNYKISSEHYGKEISVRRLSEIFVELQEQGAHNINLVTPTQYVPMIRKALDMVKHRLLIPVVYNCGGYEKISTIKQLEDYVDIYMPDIKYYEEDSAQKYSKAENYFDTAEQAVKEMLRQTKEIVLDDNGIMKRGVLIRHLVLPGHRKESMELLRWMKENLPDQGYLLSLMSQYTPVYKSSDFKEINRKITTFEYDSVVNLAVELGMTNGYMQHRNSAVEEYTPPFDLEGIERKDRNGN